MTNITLYQAQELSQAIYDLCLANCLPNGHMKKDLVRSQTDTDAKISILVAHTHKQFTGWALVDMDQKPYPLAQFFVKPEFRRQGIGSLLLETMLHEFGMLQCCPNADSASTSFCAKFEKDIYLTALSRAWIEKYAQSPVSFSTPCAVKYVY